MLTQERKQQYLNNFIQRVNGLGRSVYDDGCAYEGANGHPGCAIGCQPEFNEWKASLPVGERNVEGCSIRGLLTANPNLAKYLGVDNASFASRDIDFLSSLQSLHDQASNWDDINGKLHLTRVAVNQFCSDHTLEVPPGLYVV